MRNVAVGRAIARSYSYLIGELPGIAALSWVAALFYAGLRLWLARPEFSAPLAPLWLALGLRVALLLGSVLLTSAIAVSLTRAALGYSSPFLLAHFTIGRRELSLFWAQIRIYLIVIAMACAAGLLFAASGKAAGAALATWPVLAKSGLPLVALTQFAALLLSVLAIGYVTLRLSVLIYPVATIEDDASLARAWALGRGQVLAMLSIMLFILVPVAVANFAFDYALFGPALVDGLRGLSGAQPGHESLEMLFARAPVAMTAASTLSLIVMTALQAGASAEAYRALTEEQYAHAAEVAAVLHPAERLVPAVALAEAAASFDVPAPVFAAAAPAALIGDPFAPADHACAHPQADLTSHDGAYEVPSPAAEPAAHWLRMAPSFLAAPAPYGEAAEAGIEAQEPPAAAPVEAAPAAATSYAAYQGWAAPAASFASLRAEPGLGATPAMSLAGPEHEGIDLSAMPENWQAPASEVAGPDVSQELNHEAEAGLAAATTAPLIGV